MITINSEVWANFSYSLVSSPIPSFSMLQAHSQFFSVARIEKLHGNQPGDEANFSQATF